MGKILDLLEEETYAKRYKSHRFQHDEDNTPGIQYDEREVTWKSHGETVEHKHPVNIKEKAKAVAESPSIFSYFLDGSRRTYKVDDFSYFNNIYPIIAGQVGVGCCTRVNKEMKCEHIFNENIIVLPDKAEKDEWDADKSCAQWLYKVNNLNHTQNINFKDILMYSSAEDNKLESKGIAVIQDYMTNLEKQLVANLVSDQELDQNNYLIKDGSLEYRQDLHQGGLNLSDEHIANNYKYVVGVSKSFNPTKCKVKGGGSNSDIVANLQLYERTPAYMHQSGTVGDVCFVIWYLRIQDSKYTQNIFDGILKVEKVVTDPKELVDGVDSSEIDKISAHLINERSPVCYGSDARWANHLYPVYLTETFVKSRYLSNNYFLQLF